MRQADVFRQKQGINLLTGHPVDAIDPEAKTVSGTAETGETFELPYDKLLIATGGAPVLPDLPGFDLPGVMALKNLDHGRQNFFWVSPILDMSLLVGHTNDGFCKIEITLFLKNGKTAA